MRISDWSSDVCSSDLECTEEFTAKTIPKAASPPIKVQAGSAPRLRRPRMAIGMVASAKTQICAALTSVERPSADCFVIRGARAWTAPYPMRSEEHTSELQSLMRISYAVLCLKKKNK